MALSAYFLTGAGVAAACWAVNHYLSQRNERMALDPSARKPISGLDDMVIVGELVQHRFWRQNLSKEEKIQQCRTKFGLDTENTINIAICGNSGTGKSTFVNCVRGVPDVQMTYGFVHDKDGSAPVGITETTRKTMPYRWWIQNRERYVTLWDLPTASIISKPDVNYFEDVGLCAFDCILLLRAGRFTQFDVAICQQAIQYKIPIILVLCKADQDVSSNKKNKVRQLGHQLTENEYEEVISQTISALQENALAELTSMPGSNSSELKTIPMFVIAAQSYRDQLNNNWDRQDCPPLEMEKLLENCLLVAVDQVKKRDINYVTAMN